MPWLLIDASEIVIDGGSEGLLRLECEDMETLHDAMAFHIERIQGIAQANSSIESQAEDPTGAAEHLKRMAEEYAEASGVDLEQIKGEMTGQLALDYMRAKKLRAGLVTIAGEDLTGNGCD